jgi:hypothetical protein
MIWITVLFYTASIISLVVSCTPRERIWKPWVKGRCINRKAMGVVTAIFNAVLDLLMVALPLRVIWSLRIDRRRKLRISLVFSVGLMATACAVGRAVVSFDIIYTIGDSTYTMTPQLLWAVPEVTCVLLVLCLPALPRIFADQSPLRSLFRSLSSWTRVSAAGGGSGGNGHPYAGSQRVGIGTPPPLSSAGKWPPTISSIMGSRQYRTEGGEDGQDIGLVDMGPTRLGNVVSGNVQHGHGEHDDIWLRDHQLSDSPSLGPPTSSIGLACCHPDLQQPTNIRENTNSTHG